MKLFSIRSFILVCWTVLFTSCDLISPAVSREGRGELVSVTLISSKTKDQITPLIANFGVASFDVDTYKVVYKTTDPEGNLVNASGIVLIPINGYEKAPLFSYSRGTITRDSDTPSQNEGYQNFMLWFASTGYITVSADMLGFSESALPYHPYVHKETGANTSIDLLRAGKDLAEKEGIGTSNRVFISGYSQGGYTAMATHKALQESYQNEFKVIASAPMAGPYDVSGVMTTRMLAPEAHPNPFYLAMFLIGYQEIYQLAPSYNDLFAPPLGESLPPLFDRQHSGGEISSILPDIPKDMLNDAFVEAYTSQANHPFKSVLKENNVYEWTPEAPIRLYHCSGDQDVPVENTQVALAYFQSKGADVAWIDPNPSAGHGACAGQSIFLGKLWLDTYILATD